MERVQDNQRLNLFLLLGLALAASVAQGATGDLLVQFESQLQTLPHRLPDPWVLVGNCYDPACPGIHDPNKENLNCYYQGWQTLSDDYTVANNCQLGIGCSCSPQSSCVQEYFNAPPASAVPGTCTYTEWMAFDDGIYTLPTRRSLTIADSEEDPRLPDSPPFGANRFKYSPPYPTLRIVTGDGNLIADSLPQDGPENLRNGGLVSAYKNFNLNTGAHAVTLICRVAAGPRLASHEFVSVQVFNRRFTFGVDGNFASANYGRITYGDDTDGDIVGYAFNRTVKIAQPALPGSEDGEFFTLRAILRDNGTIQAYLNERYGLQAVGQVTLMSPGENKIMLTPEEGDETMWFDYVRVLEGEVHPPLICANPVFDVDRDLKINQDEIGFFIECATGPANATGTWDAIPFECKCLDLDDNQSIDMLEFGILQRCLTNGMNATLSPDTIRNCDNLN